MKWLLPSLLSACLLSACATKPDTEQFAGTDCETLRTMIAATPINLPDLQDLRDQEMGFESGSSFERDREKVDTFDRATEKDIEAIRAAYREKGCKA